MDNTFITSADYNGLTLATHREETIHDLSYRVKNSRGNTLYKVRDNFEAAIKWIDKNAARVRVADEYFIKKDSPEILYTCSVLPNDDCVIEWYDSNNSLHTESMSGIEFDRVYYKNKDYEVLS